jgi:hypothetical protein
MGKEVLGRVRAWPHHWRRICYRQERTVRVSMGMDRWVSESIRPTTKSSQLLDEVFVRRTLVYFPPVPAVAGIWPTGQLRDNRGSVSTPVTGQGQPQPLPTHSVPVESRSLWSRQIHCRRPPQPPGPAWRHPSDPELPYWSLTSTWDRNRLSPSAAPRSRALSQLVLSPCCELMMGSPSLTSNSLAGLPQGGSYIGQIPAQFYGA